QKNPGGDDAATAVAATAGGSAAVDPVTGLIDPDLGTGAGPGRRPRRWPALVLVMAGLALIAAGAYTTYRGAHGPHPGLPPGVAPSPTVRPTAQGHPTATPDVTSGTSSASHGTPLVTVAPALLGQPGVADVVGTLTTYFTAINDRDYQDYRSVLVGADARVGGEQDFLTRFRSTTDSQIWLVGIRRDPLGEVFATVTFRSHQDPRDSPDLVSDCLSWVVTYPMVQIDSTVRIDLVRNFALTHRPC
ncbi:MAG TPA: hypothetical protein VFX70_01440, partial [Mycobacteriales bacterium]|nr:hypothetical protein [Mycobacteriales bacterium]